MSKCIFCKIIKKESPADIIREDKSVIVFKSIGQAAPTHLLIVPREHIKSVADLANNHREILADMFYCAKDLASELKLKGYKLVFNVGKEGGQVIDHLHLHLLGGWKNQKDIDTMPHPSLDSENRKK